MNCMKNSRNKKNAEDNVFYTVKVAYATKGLIGTQFASKGPPPTIELFHRVT